MSSSELLILKTTIFHFQDLLISQFFNLPMHSAFLLIFAFLYLFVIFQMVKNFNLIILC